MFKEVELKVKREIEKILKAKFIIPTRYVQWLANIVPMMKKNGKLRVCVDFMDLNVATPKDMYVIFIVDMLVDSTTNNELLSFMEGFSGYNKILICETPRKSNLLKNGKIVISVKIRNFSRSRMTKRISPLDSSREI